MRQLTLPSGNVIPVCGLGTWRMGEHPDRFQAEADVIRGALDLGITLIDSAEMYGDGGADIVLTVGDLQELDSAFPAPQQAVQLGMR